MDIVHIPDENLRKIADEAHRLMEAEAQATADAQGMMEHLEPEDENAITSGVLDAIINACREARDLTCVADIRVYNPAFRACWKGLIEGRFDDPLV